MHVHRDILEPTVKLRHVQVHLVSIVEHAPIMLTEHTHVLAQLVTPVQIVKSHHAVVLHVKTVVHALIKLMAHMCVPAQLVTPEPTVKLPHVLQRHV